MDAARRIKAAGLLGVIGLLVITACAQSATGSPRGETGTSATPDSTSTNGSGNQVIIIPDNDIFAPYIAVTNAGDSVTWLNHDTVLHTIVTAPTTAGGIINPTQFQLVVAPGKTASLTLRQPGIYYYYCGAHSDLNGQQHAAAHTSVRPYPVAMDGFLYVRGPNLSGVSTQQILASSDGQFTPWIAVVNRGARVTWTNKSAQPLDLAGTLGYGAVNPAPLSLHIAAGASQSFTFDQPGVYDYYATEDATLDSLWLRPMAKQGMPGYPAPMEGVVVVLD